MEGASRPQTRSYLALRHSYILSLTSVQCHTMEMDLPLAQSSKAAGCYLLCDEHGTAFGAELMATPTVRTRLTK